MIPLTINFRFLRPLVRVSTELFGIRANGIRAEEVGCLASIFVHPGGSFMCDASGERDQRDREGRETVEEVVVDFAAGRPYLDGTPLLSVSVESLV